MPPGSEDDHGSDFASADWMAGLDTTNPCVDDAMNISSQIRSVSIFSVASLLATSSGTSAGALTRPVFHGHGGVRPRDVSAAETRGGWRCVRQIPAVGSPTCGSSWYSSLAAAGPPRATPCRGVSALARRSAAGYRDHDLVSALLALSR